MRRPLLPAVLAGLLVVGTAIAAPPDSPGAPLDQYEFFVRTDLVVKDRKTQLSWARNVSREVAYDPSNGCDSRTELGTGRRYPSVKELLTLVDEYPHDTYESGTIVQRAIDRSAFDGGGFSTPTDFAYWTSTPAGAGRVWVVDFRTGEVTPKSTADKAHLRCVK